MERPEKPEIPEIGQESTDSAGFYSARLSVRVEPRHVEVLDRAASNRGMNRNEFLRHLIDKLEAGLNSMET